MRMTTKLVSLLTILFVFFKFGESAKAMMSIYGDKGFLFHTKDLATTDVVGYVYEDANGAFALANCSATPDKTYFKLQSDCTVLPVASVTVTTTATETAGADTVTTKETAALKAVTAANFPATDVNTNMMVANTIATPITIKTADGLGTASPTLLITIAPVVGPASTTAVETSSIILCNNLTDASGKGFFTVVTTSSTFGQLNHVQTQAKNYPPIMKCVGAVRDQSKTATAFATFILIITDHALLTGGLSSLTFPSVALLPSSIMQNATAATVVGYINGFEACPSNGNFTFEKPSTAPCKGKLSIRSPGSDSFLSFNYNSTSYYLPVTDDSGATTCPATTTTTCEDFAFNFKYSNTLIGMLLIFMFKMLQSY